MTTPRFTSLAAAALLAASALGGAPAAPAAAQSLAQRIAAAPDGTVRFSFPLRPGVCGDGRNINVRQKDREWESQCDDGPGRVSLDLAAHRVTALRFYVGGRWRADARAGTDLGAVPAADAVAYLLDLARRGDGSPARQAIAPAALADSVVVWPQLLELARAEGRPTGVRRDATFWLSQQAAAAATRGLVDIVESEGDREVRKAAIFALSQRPQDEGTPALLKVAQNSRDPELRRQAIFWLGQSRDPRALEFFRQVLAGR